MKAARSSLVKLAMLVLVSCAVFSLKPAAAAAISGITVSPAFQQISIPLGQSEVPITFTLTNHELKPQTISLSTQDFNTLSETGGLVFVGSNPTQLQKKYGLAKWLSLSQSQISLEPGQTSDVKATILNLPNLSPGGHYGALMLSLGAINNNGISNVNLHPIASSLLFVTKLGGDTHRLSLANVQTKHSIFKLPDSVTLRFQNDGNTHVVPRGVVTIISSNNTVIKKGIINQNSDLILSSSYRQLSVPIQTVSETNGIGKYKLLVDYRFDGLDQYRRYQNSFWVVPWYVFLVVAALIILVAATFGIRNLRSWR